MDWVCYSRFTRTRIFSRTRRPVRRKERRRDYDDDDEPDWRPAAKGGSFGPARVGMLLVSISLWMYLGTFALLALFLLIAWAGASIPSALMIITGLLERQPRPSRT